MGRKLKTELLKMVLKRSELTRARFRGSSSTNKPGQFDKKTLFSNKIGERFRSKVAKLSVGNTWSSIEKEWVVVNQVRSIEQRDKCLCGRSNLKYVAYLKNKNNNKEIIAGNCCVLSFKQLI